MKSCTFFGHRDCPAGVLPALRAAVERMIQEGVDTFYVGQEGAFDAYAARILLEMVGKYPHVRFFVVLAYLPRTPLENGELQKRSILAGGVEHSPPPLCCLPPKQMDAGARAGGDRIRDALVWRGGDFFGKGAKKRQAYHQPWEENSGKSLKLDTFF